MVQSKRALVAYIMKLIDANNVCAKAVLQIITPLDTQSLNSIDEELYGIVVELRQTRRNQASVLLGEKLFDVCRYSNG